MVHFARRNGQNRRLSGRKMQILDSSESCDCVQWSSFSSKFQSLRSRRRLEDREKELKKSTNQE